MSARARVRLLSRPVLIPILVLSPRFVTAALLTAATLALAACGPSGERDACTSDDCVDAGPGDCQGVECEAPRFECTGSSGGAAAGQVTPENRATELIGGPAAQGQVGDYFLRNDRIRVIVQAPGRAMGASPYGGNIIDADFVGGPGFDQFGELSLFMRLGRTANFTRARVLCDGSAGGPAVIQMSGVDAINDFVNVPGVLPPNLPIVRLPDPNESLDLEIAATYVLPPGSTAVEIHWTFRNVGQGTSSASLGLFTDTGGEVSVFAPTLGYRGFSLEQLSVTSAAVPYVVLTAPGPAPDAPGIAYGLFPRYDADEALHQQFLIAGVHVMVFRTPTLLDAAASSGLVLAPGVSQTHRLDFVVARDPAGVAGEVLERQGQVGGTVAGTVRVAGRPAAGARVAALDAKGRAMSLFVTDAQGAFSGTLPAGTYDLVADQVGHLRSEPRRINVAAGGTLGGQDLTLPAPATVEYQVIDEDTGQPMPAKLSFVGADPSPPDDRFRENTREPTPHGVPRIVHSLSGTSAIDGPIALAPSSGSDRYRVVVSHGPEYTLHQEILEPLAPGASVAIEARLRRAVRTPGYVICDFHQHTLNSPDSPVPLRDRVISYLVEGVEFVATSDHEYVTDLRPLVSELGVGDRLSTTPGLEVTTWDYGHFNVYPLEPDPDMPNRGAVDWGNGDELYNMVPLEILARYVERGARVRQVNHPRRSPSSANNDSGTFFSTWDRAGLTFDFAGGWYGGSPERQPIMNEVLRLDPAKSIFTADIDAFELYNGFVLEDTDGDGVREEGRVDFILRDYMNFLAFGGIYTPIGSSDTHTRGPDPAGQPFTFVRVPDDSPAALMRGVGDDVAATINGTSSTPRDVVVSTAPFVRLELLADNGSCELQVPGRDMCEDEACVRQGGTLALAAGEGPARVRYQVTVDTPLWARVDTIELFVNQTFDPVRRGDNTALTPTVCFSTLDEPAETCRSALAGAPSVVEETETAQRVVAQGCIDLKSVPRRAGARGSDSYVLARAYGTGTMFPVIPLDVPRDVDPRSLVSPATMPRNVGVFPMAVTSAVLVDVDGGGYRGPFAP